MATEVTPKVRVEIGHVLFMDIVGYSKLSVDEQHQIQQQLNEIVRGTKQFRATPANKLTILPTGDGMALVFFTSPEAPVECAIEISAELKSYPQVQLRMGIHSGPVSRTTDMNQRTNIAGAGINMAQRVMDCGDARHILLSKHAAEDLEHYAHWKPWLHDLGEVEVKHGFRVPIANFYSAEVGNPALPSKFKQQARLRARQRRNWVALGGAGLAVVGVVAFVLLRYLTNIQLEKSIAVLPFENLTAEKENAYFAGGIQDQILTDLAKIGDLRVISRSSVMGYTSNRPNIREIAKTLGVAAVVEGSVQRVANRIRISVQLIKAATDEHVWAENYEKDISDIFAAQRDAAFEIASKLHAQLSKSEKARLEQKPTTNSGAYLVYLQAQDAWWYGQEVKEVEKVVIPLYRKAVELDPTFALAFAKLSYCEAFMYWNSSSLSVLQQARAHASEAIRLQPNLPEAHFALGYIHLWGDHDYAAGLAEFELARTGLPNDADVFSAIGHIQRKQGKWAESTASYEKAAELNPKDTITWGMSLAGNYWKMRDYAKAAKMFDKAIAADPNFFQNHIWRAWLEFDSKEDTRPLEQLVAKTRENVDPDGEMTFARYQLNIFQRKFDEALAVLDRSSADYIESITPTSGADYSKARYRAFAYRFKNDAANAQRYFEEARTSLEQKVQENPSIGPMHASLAQAYAGLGRKEDAMNEAKRAVELLPESADVTQGLHQTMMIAQMYAMLGDADSAIPLIEHLLSTPSGLTTSWLKLDPVWDPIRGDPRFTALCQKLNLPVLQAVETNN
jgi:TolB-like protein/Tfp pilus assembly protein PilF